MINYIRKKQLQKKKQSKNLRITNITKNKTLLIFMMFFFIAIFIFSYNLISYKNQNHSTSNIKINKQISEIDKRIKERRLNQKAEQLNIKKLHIKYKNIQDYSRTYLNKHTYFYNVKTKKNEIIKKGTNLIVIHYKNNNYYLFKKQIFAKKRILND